jgi:GAF domain-containing protein
MIRRAINALFTLRHTYSDIVERQRARALLTMTWVGAAAWLGLYALLVVPLAISGEIAATGFLFIATSLLPIPIIFNYFMVQQGRLRLAAAVFVGTFLALSVPLGFVAYADVIQLFPLLAVIAAGVLLNRRGLSLVVLIALASVAYTTLVYQASLTGVERFIPARLAGSDFISMALFVLTAGAFLYAFSGTPERTARAAYNAVSQFRAVGLLSARAAVDEESAIEGALRIAYSELNYSLVQVFLLGDRPERVRRCRYTEDGLLLLDTAPDTVVLDVVARAVPIVIRTGDRQAAEHLTSGAMMSVSLPVQFEGALIGVLDVQRARYLPIDATQIAVLEQLAAQIGRMLSQFRRISALENDLRTQEGIAGRLRAQIADLQRRAEGTTITGWERYLRGFGVGGFGYDFQSGTDIVTASDLPPLVRAALERGELHIDRADRRQIVSAPIRYRGQMLGAMVFEIPIERAIGAAEVELINTVADRLGNALENNRLFELNQAQAQRERKANEIGGLLLSVTDVDQLLALAAETFNEALGATHTRVSLQADTFARISSGDADPQTVNGTGKESAS